MRYQFVAAALVASSVQAQSATNASTYASGLLTALASFNLTTLSSVAAANAATIVPLLMGGGNLTVFAPTDAAFAALPAATLANATLVANVVLYHVVNGHFPNLNATPVVSTTALTAPGLVNLPNAGPQAIVLTGSNGTASVVQAPNTVNSTAMATYMNLNIYIIPQVLSVPIGTVETATAANLTSLVGAITTYAPSLAPVAQNYAGLTIFAPTNAAFGAVAATIASLNASVITTVLSNHVVVGRVLYSSALTNGLTFPSAAGQTMTVINNATGIFISQLNGTVIAQVTKPNVLTRNGVVHVISAVLANTMSAPAASGGPVVAPSGTASGTAGTPSTTARTGAAATLSIGSGLAFAALALGLVL